MPRAPKREGTPDYVSRSKHYQEIKKYSRAPPDAKLLEAGRYYTALIGSDGQIYIYWQGTKFSALDQWQEDFAGEFAQRRIPAWDKELDYVRNKYGMESSTVHHDGYSRGGAFAEHMGGIGYGSAHFPKYPPADGSQSRASGDYFHDHILPTVNEFNDLASSVMDPSPSDHPHAMDSDNGAFDTPRGPVVEKAAPKQSVPMRDYSGFACSYVGFPAKIKYDRKRSITHSVLGAKHAHPRNRRSVKRKINFEDSAMRPAVNDTPMQM